MYPLSGRSLKKEPQTNLPATQTQQQFATDLPFIVANRHALF